MKEKLWTRKFLLMCIINFFMAFAFYTLMPVLPLHLTNTMGLATSKIGVVLSSYTIALLVVRIFSGYMVDNFNRKLLYIGFALAFSLLLGVYPFVVSITAFVLLRFMHGATWGLTTVAGSTIVIDVIPSSRRAEGIGYYGLNMNIAMAIAPWIALIIYKKTDLQTLIIISVLIGLFAVFLISTLKVPQKEIKDPVDSKLSLDRFILIKSLPISPGLMLCAVVYGMIISYGALFAEKVEIPNAGLLFLSMAIGIGISRIISGSLVDRGYIHIICMLATLVLGVSVIFFAFSTNIYQFCGFALLMGTGFGSMFPAYQTLFVNMAEHNQRGTANSTYFNSFDVGLGMGMLIGGFFSYSNAFILGGVLALLSIPYYYFVSKPVYEKRRLDKIDLKKELEDAKFEVPAKV